MYIIGMNPNPFKSPELFESCDSDGDDVSRSGKPIAAVNLMRMLFWSNVGLVVAYLLLSGFDWAYVSWVSPDARRVSVAWSKLFFMLVATNVIIYFAFTNQHKSSSKPVSQNK